MFWVEILTSTGGWVGGGGGWLGVKIMIKATSASDLELKLSLAKNTFEV